MQNVRARFGRAWGKVCVTLGLLLGLLTTRAAGATPPIELEETPNEPGVVVYPARAPGSRPVTVVLHGMCSEPMRVCRHFAEEVTAEQNLVCPRARVRCEGGGSIWPQRDFAGSIEGAVERARGVLPAAIDERRGRTLIGYSLGAFRALTLAQSSDGRYPRVMLIGAKIYPDRRRLAESGVERLLLSAGDWDMMNQHMQKVTGRLVRDGVQARFLGLGPVGHFFTPSFARYLPEALAWLEG